MPNLLVRSVSDLAEQFDLFLRTRIARNVIYLQLLCTGATYPQRASSSFGPLTDLALGYTPVGLAWLPSSGQIAVLGQENPTVYLYSLNSSASIIQTNEVSLSMNATDIVAPPGGTVAPEEFALLVADEEHILVMQKAGETYHETSLELPTRSQRVAYGDINSDRRDDLLLFGKRRSGVSTLLRQKDGQYAKGVLLFPDFSVSSIQCVDLNGDGITDVFMVNWLSNQIDLFYGIGQGVFSEQVEVPLPGEPDDIAVSPVTSERTVRIAVTIPDQNLVSTFRCNSTGEMVPTGSLKIPVPPLHVHFADLNGDQEPDLVVTTSRAAYVFLARGSAQFGQATAFGPGNDIRVCEEEDLDDDHKTDLMLIDRASRRLVVVGNSDWSGRVHWPATYATGIFPAGAAVADVNGDGLPDIAIANFGSGTLSVLLNRGNGLFEGQKTISISEKPVAVATVNAPPLATHTLLTSHASVDKINIVRFTNDVIHGEVAAVPTGPGPYIVFAKRDSLSSQLEMLVRNTNRDNGSQSLSMFQQIGSGHLLEKSLRASLPGRITALTVGDYSGSGKYELIFVTYDRIARQSVLSIAFSDQEFDFRTVKTLFSFPDSTGSVHSIISGFVDDDLHKDLVLVMSPPRSALGVVYGKGEGAFRDSVETLRDVHPLNGDDVLVKDVNGDGFSDLTWIDTERKAVVTAFGKGHHRFDSPVMICPANHITSIQVASMKVPSIQDLILLDGPRGSASVVFGPFGK